MNIDVPNLALQLVVLVLSTIFWLLLIANIIKDFYDTHKLNIKMEKSYNKIIEDTSILDDKIKLLLAINEAGLMAYKTPSGNKYIIVPKEDR